MDRRCDAPEPGGGVDRRTFCHAPGRGIVGERGATQRRASGGPKGGGSVIHVPGTRPEQRLVCPANGKAGCGPGRTLRGPGDPMKGTPNGWCSDVAMSEKVPHGRALKRPTLYPSFGIGPRLSAIGIRSGSASRTGQVWTLNLEDRLQLGGLEYGAAAASLNKKIYVAEAPVVCAQQNCAVAQQMKRAAPVWPPCRPVCRRSSDGIFHSTLRPSGPDMSKPSARATVKISLSPRPHMFMQMM